MQNNNVIGIYANTRGMNGIQPTCGNPINRTSLMSTGSSEEGTSSGSASCGESSQISSSMEQAVENGGNIDFDVSNTYFGHLIVHCEIQYRYNYLHFSFG